ncbi:MAG: hypothetical protein IJZ13_04930 [Clostridia bacterium]|nr:hypothetical protein [Clostridia bacterium]
MRKGVAWLLAAVMGLALLAYRLNLPEEMPEDFAFSLTWGTFGISSYNSETGLLVKTTDVFERDPAEYQTMLTLSDEQMAEVYALIRKLNPEAYPEKFDISPFTGSDPSMTLGLSVRYGEYEKAVMCVDVAQYDDPHVVGKNKRFLECHKAIRDILTATPEWQALPDYEVHYA